VIPLACTDTVEYRDDDGVVFVFRPKTGKLERRLCEMFAATEGKTPVEQIDLRNSFVNEILVGWRGNNLPAFPTTGAADMFSSDQINKLLMFWGKAGDISAEEKKS
jgi:hypothetical protein